MVYGKVFKNPDPVVGAAYLAEQVQKYDMFQLNMSKCPNCGCLTDTAQLLKHDLCYTCMEDVNEQ